LSAHCLPVSEEAQTLARIHPSQSRFTCGTRSIFNGSATSAQSPRPAKTRHVPRGPSPGQGVTFPRVASGATSVGVTPPSKLIRPHAPNQIPPTASGCPLVGGSLQVAASPCWKMVLPDVISADLSLDAWTPTPAAPVVLMLVSSHRTSAFPTLGPGRRSAIFHTATSVWVQFRGCSHSLMFRPPGLLAPQVAPTYAVFRPRGSQGFYVRAYYGSLPPRSPDMLAVRTEQLTAWGLSPHKIRSLVGCSPNG
jgi:hypothetical protein